MLGRFTGGQDVLLVTGASLLDLFVAMLRDWPEDKRAGSLPHDLSRDSVQSTGSVPVERSATMPVTMLEFCQVGH